jgi:hypothetical protein
MHGWLPRLPRAMVCTWVALPLVLLAATALAQDEPPLKRMEGAMRVRVLAAMAGLIILGFGLVLLTWLGARVTQRYRWGTSYFRPTQRPGEHDWARRPLIGEEGDESPRKE